MLVKIEARIRIFPGTVFHFPSTSVPPGTFLRLCVAQCIPLSAIVVFTQYVIRSSQTTSAAAPARARSDTGRQRAPSRPRAQLHQRKSSFHGKQVPAGQTVEVLALAGFFYVGESFANCHSALCFYALTVVKLYHTVINFLSFSIPLKSRLVFLSL